MNKNQRAILYGMAIGDGHISYRTRFKDGKYRYEQAELIIGHSPKQLQYLEWKAQTLHSIFGGKPPKVAETKHTLKSNGKTYKGFRVAKTNPYFRQMHKTLYKEGHKKITRQIVSYLNEQSLAIIFMDDGSISHNTNKQGFTTSLNFVLCLQLSEEEADIVVDWLKSFDIDAKKTLSKGKWDIRGGTQATLNLVKTILDHLHPNLFYKLKSVAKLTICKSARHPNFYVLGDDIVQSVETTINSVEK